MAKVLTPNATRVALEERQRKQGIDLTPGATVLVRMGTRDTLAVVLASGVNSLGVEWVDVRPQKIRVTKDSCCSASSRRAKSRVEILAEKNPARGTPSWKINAN